MNTFGLNSALLLSALVFSTSFVAHAANPPVRYAKAKATLSRGYFEKDGDAFKKKEEIVCVKEFDIPVADLTNDGANSGGSIACDTTIDGKAVTAGLGVSIQLMNYENKPIKALTSNLSVYEKTGTLIAAQKPLFSGFATEDLGLSSMLVYLFAVPEVTCQIPTGKDPVCSAPNNDTISAMIRIEDK